VESDSVSACRLGLGLALLALTSTSVAAQELAITRVRLDSLAVLSQLARLGFEVAGVDRSGANAYALIVTSGADRVRLGAVGLAAAALPAPATPPVVFRDFPRMAAALDSLASAGRIALDTIGFSREGRPMLAAKVGTAGDAPARPNVLFLGAHHAREWISAEVALRLVVYLSDAAQASLLADRDVWVIPVVNPDGYQYTFDVERLWRKNRAPNADGSFGVDLNRNYPSFWALDDVGSSPDPSAETYRGPAPASEPEIQAIMTFHADHPPVVALSYHSFSDVVLYPYGHAAGLLPPDLGPFVSLAGTPLASAVPDHLPESARTSYFPGPAWQLYPVNGEYTEWAYRAHGTLALTVELTAGCCLVGSSYAFEFPDDSAAVATVFADNLPLALGAIQMAGTAQPATTGFETVWPEVRVVGPPGPPSRAATLSGTAVGGSLDLLADSLDQGALQWRWKAALPATSVGTRITVPTLDAHSELVYADGAEQSSGWSGGTRDSVESREGRWHWLVTTDTLRSPDISLAGVREPHLAMWIHHAGSLFLPEREATIEASGDGGASWTALAKIAGAGGVWYPLTVPLPAALSVRLRVYTRGLPLAVDAVHVFGTPIVGVSATAAGTLGVSENPVRSSRVYFTWQAEAGEARLSVFTFNGQLVYRTVVTAADGQAGWDLTNTEGTTIRNGAYVVILEIGGVVLRRRLFVARSP
jgi:Zinc carboxypeptidase